MSRVKLREPGYLAALLHRLSGIAVALFLPVHFLTLGLAIESEARLNDALLWFQRPAVQLAEWVLVVALSVHLSLGVRVLLIELGRRYRPRLGWIPVSLSASVLLGLLFAVLG